MFRRKLTSRQVASLMREMQLLLDAIDAKAVEASQKHAPVEIAKIHRAFTSQQYYNVEGKAKAIEPFGEQWRDRKRARSWDMRRGWATGRLGRAVGSRSIIRETPAGYRLDLSRADKIVRRYTSRGNPNSFVARKAPGLMNMQKGWRERHLKAIRKAVRPLIAKLRRVAKRLRISGKTVHLDIEVRLDPALEAAARHNRFGTGGKTWIPAGRVQGRNQLGQFTKVRGQRFRRR